MWTSTVRVSPRVVVAPDTFQQLIPGERLAGVAHQEREQLEGLRLYRKLDAVAQKAVSGHINQHRAELDHRRSRLLRPTLGRRGGTWARTRALSSRRLKGFVT